MYQTLNLSHAEAQEMVDAARRRAEAVKKAIAIAVSDSHGEFVAFLRMDGCLLPPVQIAITKAFTAARECQPSQTVGESSRARPFPMTNFGDPRCAVGVSGMDEKTDDELAACAADLVTRKAEGDRA